MITKKKQLMSSGRVTKCSLCYDWKEDDYEIAGMLLQLDTGYNESWHV